MSKLLDFAKYRATDRIDRSQRDREVRRLHRQLTVSTETISYDWEPDDRARDAFIASLTTIQIPISVIFIQKQQYELYVEEVGAAIREVKLLALTQPQIYEYKRDGMTSESFRNLVADIRWSHAVATQRMCVQYSSLDLCENIIIIQILRHMIITVDGCEVQLFRCLDCMQTVSIQSEMLTEKPPTRCHWCY